MSPVLVAGIGSPFGADRLGWQVIDSLTRQDFTRPAYIAPPELLKLDRPGSSLIEAMKGRSQVILIDAVQADAGGRGKLVCLEAGDIVGGLHSASSHGFGLAESLALAQALGMMPDRLMLLGLDVGGSPEQAFDDQAVRQLAARVVDCLDGFIKV